MKKFFLIVIVFIALGSCEKDRVETNAVTVTINTANFPTGSQLLVSLVPSEQTDQSFPIDARINRKTVIKLSEAQKSLLKSDAYLSVILFDYKGEYLTQNFFPFVDFGEGEQILTLE